MTPRRGAMMLVWIVLLAIPLIHGGPTIYRTMSFFYVSVVIMAGLHIVTGLSRAISLCHAALVGVGAYGAALASTHLHTWPIISVVAGAAASGTTAFLLAWVTRRLDEHYLAFATLAFSEILSNFFRSATNVTGGSNGLSGVPPLSVAGFQLDTPQRYLWITAAAGALALALVRTVDRSVVGRALRAYGDQGRRIESLGIGAHDLRLAGFTIGGAVAGVAGGLAAHIDGFVGPESYGVVLSIAYLCFLVIGGLGWTPGVLVAAAFASIAPELFRGLLAWQMVVVCGVAILVLYLRADFSERTVGKGAADTWSRS